MLPKGTTAPGFELSGIDASGGDWDSGYDIRTFSLQEMIADGPVLLAFYPGDFSPVCTEELCALRDLHVEPEFRELAVYAISRDSLFTHEAFAYEHELQFPLLSDVEGDVCRVYDAVHDETVDGRGVEQGLPKRTLYVVDEDREISYAWQSDDPYAEPDIEAAMDELAA